MVPRSKPDSGPLRLAIGMSGVALASAMATALLASAGTAAGTAGGGGIAQTTVILPAQPTPPVTHVVKYVQLNPGQTAPPQAVVKQAPAPTPRVVTVTTTQSGVVVP
jgi:hypothetical protein